MQSAHTNRRHGRSVSVLMFPAQTVPPSPSTSLHPESHVLPPYRPPALCGFGRQVSLSPWPRLHGAPERAAFATGAGFTNQYRSIGEEGGPDYWTKLGVEKEKKSIIAAFRATVGTEQRDGHKLTHSQRGTGQEQKSWRGAECFVRCTPRCTRGLYSALYELTYFE